jgi:hypothetical protein
LEQQKPMNDTVVLAITSIIVAIIGAAATIMSSFISRGNGKDAPKDKLILPEGYTSPARSLKRKLSWRVVILIICVAIVGVSVAVIVNPANSGSIRFSSVLRPKILSPDLQWDGGSSEMSSYSIDGKMLNITAAAHTWPNFPMIQYKSTLTGDFSVTVKMTFVPDAPVIETAQMAGIVIHPINAHLAKSDDKFPNDWVAVSKNVTDAGSLVGCRGSWVDYSSDTVFLKIERLNHEWQCAYSNNGENWSYLNVLENGPRLQDQQFVVSLFAYSETDNAINVTFSDWQMQYER